MLLETVGGTPKGGSQPTGETTVARSTPPASPGTHHHHCKAHRKKSHCSHCKKRNKSGGSGGPGTAGSSNPAGPPPGSPSRTAGTGAQPPSQKSSSGLITALNTAIGRNSSRKYDRYYGCNATSEETEELYHDVIPHGGGIVNPQNGDGIESLNEDNSGTAPIIPGHRNGISASICQGISAATNPRLAHHHQVSLGKEGGLVNDVLKKPSGGPRYQQLPQQDAISNRANQPRRQSETSCTSMESTLWQEDFKHRPSWCDASLALRQVNRGKARGNKPALWVRSFMQRTLYFLGNFIQAYFGHVLFFGCLTMCLFCIGLKNVQIETDIVQLWVEKGGRLEREMQFQSKISQQVAAEQVRSTRQAGGGTVGSGKSTTAKPKSANPRPVGGGESGIGGGFQVLIQTPRHEGLNMLNQKDLLLHTEVLENISKLAVDMYGEKWTLADICFKPPAPQVELGSLTDMVQFLLDKIIPCVIITPTDCFWEGAKPLGPFPPVDVGTEFTSLIPSLPASGKLSWKNLDPLAVIKDVEAFFPLGMVGTLFERAGLAAAYQVRPCIDPFDPECPKRAPNHWEKCGAVEHIVKWNRGQRKNEQLVLTRKADLSINETKRLESALERMDAPPPSTTAAQVGGEEEDVYDNYANYYDYDGDGAAGDGGLFGMLLGGAGAASSDNSIVCTAYEDSVIELLKENPTIVEKIGLPEDLRPKIPDFPQIMTKGCNGFASSILNWPEEMIVGGVRHDDQGNLIHSEAFQSVMMVASPHDVYARFKNGNANLKPNLNMQAWNPQQAQQIVQAWQRNFTEMLYNYPNNTEEGTDRQIHPLASTSVGDMLTEFSQFKFTVIFVGYFLMLIYAGLCLCSWKERGVQSCSGLGITGVLLVTFASVSGLGASTMLGIKFNAATTQIVPFLTLGLGVDDMFLLVSSYQELVGTVGRNELGCLLKETGLSVLLTSINNIFAFLCGSLLPVPALRSFCLQTAILLFFNVLAILTIFPSIIAADLVRRRNKYVDILCCIKVNQDKIIPQEKEYGKGGLTNNGNSKSDEMDMPPPSYNDVVGRKSTFQKIMSSLSIEHFVKYYYSPFLSFMAVKVCVVIFFTGLLGAGVYGLKNVHLGLELTDVIPKGTAPYAFLRAREKYFSFYPMNAVLKSVDDNPIDFPNKQILIQQYRDAIGKSSFVVQNEGKIGEVYWLEVMRKWLNLLMEKYDSDRQLGRIVTNATAVDPDPRATLEGKLAYKLICQIGDTIDCTRNGKVRLFETVDGETIIRRDGFYHYLTAWYNNDQMMYHVAQPSFVPPPQAWGNNENDYKQLVPQAQGPKYSQIPFFLNGLVDTEATMEAITGIRAVCDKFNELGLPNYPSGIPFTFWEQYLNLVAHLLKALGIITIAVFIVISILLMSPWTGAIIVSVLVMMNLELAGFMGIAGLKLNPVSAVSLITAVGIGVEFTVHISLSFLTALGSRNDRMYRTLDHMFKPVIHGGISTLLGIIMLAFSEFEFIVRYFFMVMTALIIIGLLNGLVLLPVMLSLIGPTSEVRSVDGTGLVQPPTPELKPRNGRHKGDSTELTAVEGGGRQNTPMNGFRRNSIGRRSGEVPYRRHDSLSTIEEEPTPPNSTTPPAFLAAVQAPQNRASSPLAASPHPQSTVIAAGR